MTRVMVETCGGVKLVDRGRRFRLILMSCAKIMDGYAIHNLCWVAKYLISMLGSHNLCLATQHPTMLGSQRVDVVGFKRLNSTAFHYRLFCKLLQ